MALDPERIVVGVDTGSPAEGVLARWPHPIPSAFRKRPLAFAAYFS